MGRLTLDKVLAKELFYQMPKWIYDLDLKSLDREIYMLCYENYKLSLLNGWINEKGEIYFYNSQEKLAEKVKADIKTVRISFKKLIDLGLIEFEKENGKANKYYLIQVETTTKNGTSTKNEGGTTTKNGTGLDEDQYQKRYSNKNEYINKNEINKMNKEEPSINPNMTYLIQTMNISEFLKEKLLELIIYRQEIGKPYKTMTSIDKLIQQVGKDFKDEKHLADSIDNCIAGGYGAVFPKKELLEKKTKEEKKQVFTLENLRS